MSIEDHIVELIGNCLDEQLMSTLPECPEVDTDYGPQNGSFDDVSLEDYKIKSLDLGELDPETNAISVSAHIDLTVDANISGDAHGFHEPGEPDPYFSENVSFTVSDVYVTGEVYLEDGEIVNCDLNVTN